MKLTRAARTDGIVLALWLAWAIITPIDWVWDRWRGRRGKAGVRHHLGSKL